MSQIPVLSNVSSANHLLRMLAALGPSGHPFPNNKDTICELQQATHNGVYVPWFVIGSNPVRFTYPRRNSGSPLNNMRDVFTDTDFTPKRVDRAVSTFSPLKERFATYRFVRAGRVPGIHNFARGIATVTAVRSLPFTVAATVGSQFVESPSSYSHRSKDTR